MIVNCGELITVWFCPICWYFLMRNLSSTLFCDNNSRRLGKWSSFKYERMATSKKLTNLSYEIIVLPHKMPYGWQIAEEFQRNKVRPSNLDYADIQLQACAIHDFIRRLGWTFLINYTLLSLCHVHILRQDHNANINRSGFELSRTPFKGEMHVLIMNQTWHKNSLTEGVLVCSNKKLKIHWPHLRICLSWVTTKPQGGAYR